MRIALLHYHLKQGGVTSVIRHQVEAIRTMGGDPLILTGEPPETPFACDVRVVEGLAYDRLLPTGLSAEKIARSVKAAMGKRWPRGPHLLHVHNPTLAKNRYLQQVLGHLQQRGIRILCQIHDFAEDGRPGAYGSAPYLPHCHYVVINPRDQLILRQAGLRSRGCHLLPNAVTLQPPPPRPEGGLRGVLYPIRAIRRKNIGEAILHALYLGANGPLIFTLPPNSPADVKSYLSWKSFCREHRLPVEFDAGVDAAFDALLSRCRFVITTSITEGFGFAFLEAWAAGKALWGRMLPDICRGFEANGLEFPWLYTRLPVPLAWLDRKAVRQRWTAALASAHHRFDLDCPAAYQETAWQSIAGDGLIDFGLLNESMQRQVMVRLLEAPADRRQLEQLNPLLQRPQPPDHADETIARNAAAIDVHYRPDTYADRLESIYQGVVTIDVRHQLDRAALARAFLSPHDFSLLKWDLPDG